VSLILRGKVREVHDVGDGRLVIVTSDRISAYDVIMPTEIPGKGQVLTGLSVHWFARMADLVPNHLLGWRLSEMPDGWRHKELAGRVMLVRALDMLPVECVVRGYLIGSGWRDYQATGATSGVTLPEGLEQAGRLPEPIFTPAGKAAVGEHDENITMADVVAAVGPGLAAEAERVSLAVYERAAADCREAGIILADSKFEMGVLRGTGGGGAGGAGGAGALVETLRLTGTPVDSHENSDSQPLWPAGASGGSHQNLGSQPLWPAGGSGGSHENLGSQRKDQTLSGLILGDEVCTPDSSRFWPTDTWAPGTNPTSFDKQYLRDWLDQSGWDHSPPAPELPMDVVTGTRERYVEAYERITGRPFTEWLKEAAQ
jgi:phosphoribosylaminoimidazole-succinocarboxamide synthase